MPRPAAPAALSPEGLLARVLYRDGLMLVIDKPAGLPVHAGPGGGPNLEALFDALRFGLPRPPALAHRLDRDTSGCLVLGRHRKALAKLGRLFHSGRVEKVYWAVVAGRPPADEGRIELPLRKLTPKAGWRMAVDPKGQPAVTDYRVLGRSDGLAWLELRPRTGRTHQIRVHCAALGCPVLGDPVYGRAAGDPPPDRPLHLHARAVTVPLYPKREAVAVAAPPPPHMIEALRACGYAAEEPPASRLGAGAGPA
jgi:tRNA pseudouridine32 synthase/23S rRNA pseudouridine746 synthase/23S rRNA pseudouridine1911/1915/1917 synthase